MPKFLFPSLQQRGLGHKKNAKAKGMQQAISRFNWKKAFESLSINEKVDLLNATLLNVFRNYIPN